jgi:hypothetical protein
MPFSNSRDYLSFQPRQVEDHNVARFGPQRRRNSTIETAAADPTDARSGRTKIL